MQESTDRTRTEKNREIKDQAGPGPTKFGKTPTEPDQDQKKKLENLGPSRTDRSSDQAVRGSLLLPIFTIVSENVTIIFLSF